MDDTATPQPPAGPRLSLRAERAAVTRRRILAAARRRFARDGYAATTLTGVAADAGVAVQTIYAVYRSKAGIMRALRDLTVDQPEARVAFTQAMTQAAADRALALFARSIRLRWELTGDIVTTLRDAATSDAVIRTEVDAALTARQRGVTSFASALCRRFVLAIDPNRAAAILLALSLPELHAELVGVLGWTSDEYEAWLATAMRRELLGS